MFAYWNTLLSIQLDYGIRVIHPKWNKLLGDWVPTFRGLQRESGYDINSMFRIKRGGLITFHGPGQLVAYPILNLRSMSVDGSSIGVKRYVSLLEEALIRVVAGEYGLKNVGRTDHPGKP